MSELDNILDTLSPKTEPAPETPEISPENKEVVLEHPEKTVEVELSEKLAKIEKKLKLPANPLFNIQQRLERLENKLNFARKELDYDQRLFRICKKVTV